MIQLIENMALASQVIFHPEVVADISEDDAKMDSLPTGPIYLVGLVGNEPIGAFVIEKRGRFHASVHVQVIPEYRKQYASEFGRQVIEWTWANTDLEKLTAEIPETHPNVAMFAMRMGFEIEGCNRRSIMKGGKLSNQWYMGLSRDA